MGDEGPMMRQLRSLGYLAMIQDMLRTGPMNLAGTSQVWLRLSMTGEDPEGNEMPSLIARLGDEDGDEDVLQE